MAETTPSAPGRIPSAQRGLLALLAAGLAGALALAGWLHPAPGGYGTHQQLGLPPCTMVALCGVRCPTCGMTTSWACLVRGDVRGALRANVTGTLLGAWAGPIAVWLAVAAACGRWAVWRPNGNVGAWWAGALVALCLVEWVWRVWVPH